MLRHCLQQDEAGLFEERPRGRCHDNDQQQAHDGVDVLDPVIDHDQMRGRCRRLVVRAGCVWWDGHA